MPSNPDLETLRHEKIRKDTIRNPTELQCLPLSSELRLCEPGENNFSAALDRTLNR